MNRCNRVLLRAWEIHRHGYSCADGPGPISQARPSPWEGFAAHIIQKDNIVWLSKVWAWGSSCETSFLWNFNPEKMQNQTQQQSSSNPVSQTSNSVSKQAIWPLECHEVSWAPSPHTQQETNAWDSWQSVGVSTHHRSILFNFRLAH